MSNKRKEALLMAGLLFFLSCGSESSGENQVEVLSEDSIVEVDADTLDTPAIDSLLADLSYEKLKADIDNSVRIKQEYLQGSFENKIRGDLIYHRILKETDNYLFISTGGPCDAGVECYYLISFSTKDGQIVSYLDKGQSFEAGSPDEFGWTSENEFTLSNYTYDIIEDEGGDYSQGELLDSAITLYSLNNTGEIEIK